MKNIKESYKVKKKINKKGEESSAPQYSTTLPLLIGFTNA